MNTILLESILGSEVVIIFVIFGGLALLSYRWSRQRAKKRSPDIMNAGSNKDLEGFKKALAHRKVDVNALDIGGISPLLYAVTKFGQKGIVEELIEKGAHIDWQDINGYTALHYAAKGSKKTLIKLLVEKGANTSLKNEDGKTPLDIVTEKGKQDLIKLLS